MEQEEKQCQNCKTQFTIDSEDFKFYEKIKVPPPTWCPECRMVRRMAWRNEHVFFRRRDDATGKEMISGFPPNTPFLVYNRDYWWSDAWDPMQYGREYDFSRPFFEQFRELMYAVPWPSRSVMNLVNSDYSDQAAHLKNCYLCFNCDYLENCAYLVRGNNVKDCFDVLHVQFSELLYECVMIGKGFRNFFSTDCEGSTDLWFSKQCVGCTNCFGCVNLRKRAYHIWNQPYSKEEYFKKLEAFNLGSYSALQALREQAYEFWKKFPVKYLHGIRNTNSSGDMLSNTKNVRQSFGIDNGQNLRYCQFLYLGATDSYDHTVWGNQASQMYEALTCGEEVDNLRFCFDCWPACRNLEYSIGCRSSSDLLGCISM